VSRSDGGESNSLDDLDRALQRRPPRLTPERKAALGARIMTSLGPQDQLGRWFRPVFITSALATATAATVAGILFLSPQPASPGASARPGTAVVSPAATGSLRPGDVVEASPPRAFILASTGASISLAPGASVQANADGSLQLIRGLVAVSGRSRLVGKGWEAFLEAPSSANFALSADGLVITVTAGSLTVEARGAVCTGAAGQTIDVPLGETCAVRDTAPGSASPAAAATVPAPETGNSGGASGQQDDPPGNSGGAPGQQDDPPGNSGDAPGRQDNPPGNSGDAPGQQDDPPGNFGDPPGQQHDPPGNSGDAPGQPDNPPGNSGDAPGQPDDPPGNSGDAPGQPDDPPGNSGDAPGQPDDPPGNSGDAPGQQDDPPGNSGGATGQQEQPPGNSGDAPGQGSTNKPPGP
jgi:hypothetical protein